MTRLIESERRLTESGRPLKESVRVVPLGTQGCHALDVKHSTRLWNYYHERYCITLITAGQAQWRYRKHYSEASTRGLMLMEPGEVHVNTSVEAAGSFFAVCIAPEQVSELTQEFRTRELHFSAQFLRAKPCIAQLGSLQSMANEVEPEVQEEQIGIVLHEVLRHASEQPLFNPGRAPSLVRRGAKILKELYHSDRLRTVDVKQVAREVGMSYHWFVHSFRQEFGLPPYRFVQAVRCAYARSLFALGPCAGVTTMRDVAIVAGYADTAHMVREFRRAYGLTPLEMANGMGAAWSTRPKHLQQRLVAC